MSAPARPMDETVFDKEADAPMPHSCNLIIDSCCDLPFEAVDRDGVELIEFPYVMSDGEHADDLYRASSAHDFYQAMRDGEEPTTAQVPVPVFRAAFERAVESGVPTVYLSFSSGLSGSFDAAVLVHGQIMAEHPDAELYLVDTHLASVAEGLLVHEALRQRDKGLTARELAQWAEEARYFVDAEFMVEDLEALRRGGRIPGSVAYAGSKLDVKPMLTIAPDGKLSLAGVARGRKKGIKQLAEYYQKRVAESVPGQCVVVAGADCPKDVGRLKEALGKVDDSILFLESSIGPVIGSHVGRLFVNKYPDYRIVNLDKLTYAGNLANLRDIENAPNYTFVKADICDYDTIREVFCKYDIDGVIHLAAESHVDRSIKDPFIFARTNVMGTLSLLQAAKEQWNGNWEGKRFYHISTDEVYGALQFDGTLFTEETRYDPHSPYSAAKASSDHFVRAYHDTYGLPTIVTNCSNNYGPYQHVEKFIPRQITNLIDGVRPKLYGDGLNVRDWIHTEDHSSAVWTILTRGRIGETYLIGADGEKNNITVLREILKAFGRDEDDFDWVRDRPGHDRRYAIDSTKLRRELGWEPAHTDFAEGLAETIAWYRENEAWWRPAKEATEAKYAAQGQ